MGRLDRALGALGGVALGDAMGMPSQILAPAAIRGAYGRIEGLVAPVPGHPVSHGLVAGSVTDDTEQTLILARLMIEGDGRVDPLAWARALLDWEAGVAARGFMDLLGPSTKAALAALQAGAAPEAAGRRGATNGAAMRVAPVGVAVPPGDLGRLAARVADAARVTHATVEAIGAAAVAAVVSLGVDGAGFEDALPAALEAAALGSALGAPAGERDRAGRIALALEVAREGSAARLADAVGTSVASRESVAAAFGVVRLAGGDPWRAAVIAAHIGGDTDTIGAIACGMAGACAGWGALPAGPMGTVVAVNGLDLAPVAEGLLRLRSS